MTTRQRRQPGSRPAPPPPRGRRAGLSRREIAACALRLLDAEGIEGLTMRRLAAALGVGTMTLYGYFPDKEALTDAVVELATEDVTLPDASLPWREQIRALMGEVHRLLVAHPAGVVLRMRRPVLTPGALLVTDAAMRCLAEAGFAPAEAARAYRLLFVYTFAVAAFSSPDPDLTARQGRRALVELSAETHPGILGAGEELVASMMDPQELDHGLDVILEGLAARLEHQRRPRSGTRRRRL